MKAKQRQLLVLTALVLLAAAALFGLTRANRKAEQAASEAAEGTIPLSTFSADEVQRIVVEYGGETFTLDAQSGDWTLAEDPAYHLDASACQTMVTALSALNAKRALTWQDGEDYGFDDPQAIVTVTAAGQTNTFAFGAENSVTGDLYVQKAGDEAVYTVDAKKLGCFEVDKASLFGAFQPAGLTVSAIESVRYTLASGEVVSLKAVSEPESASDGEADADSSAYETVWRLASDPGADLDEEAVNSLLSALSSYVSGQITDADPAAYGFEAPLLTADVITADGACTLTYACGTDGYYLMVTGDSSVYTVDASTAAALQRPAEELLAEDAEE